jgi:LTXXQ motif family protein
MRKIGAYFAIAALATVVAAPPPAAAFGISLGPFHIGFPFFRHHHRHHLYMRATPNDAALPDRQQQGVQQQGVQQRGMTSALIYPSVALPAIFQNVFWPANSSPWQFGYQAIFTTAFAKAPPAQDARLCQQPFDPNAIVGRISAQVSPTADQSQLLQRLGGALGAASGFLAKSCPAEIPSQPVARLQLMESQIEELAMALDIVRQPLQDFENSLSRGQQARYATPATPAASSRQNAPSNLAAGCAGSAGAINWSIDQIDRSVQPTAEQQSALGDVKQAFGKAAADLEAHCPTAMPPTALGRLETIEARLDSTWRAVLSIQVALTNFETKLSDDQKDRFDAMDFAAAR